MLADLTLWLILGGAYATLILSLFLPG